MHLSLLLCSVVTAAAGTGAMTGGATIAAAAAAGTGSAAAAATRETCSVSVRHRPAWTGPGSRTPTCELLQYSLASCCCWRAARLSQQDARPMQMAHFHMLLAFLPPVCFHSHCLLCTMPDLAMLCMFGLTAPQMLTITHVAN